MTTNEREDTSLIPALHALAERFEGASTRYAAHHGFERDDDWFLLKLQEELGELTQAWVRQTGRGRRSELSAGERASQLADETAELLGHVLLFARRHELDLASAILRKWRFDP